ncbi:Protein-export membrane protein SecF (TC 3.A.5.1.1) [Vibrio chagasii]|nr:Protein-export membrane protein SecF (TC 3.A.5.1.1) [Vibrio chagasii]CAH7330571.1 Protein-export membrane protein SecF (TC 3.A.5.1.1) [Vibrio chagasii]
MNPFMSSRFRVSLGCVFAILCVASLVLFKMVPIKLGIEFTGGVSIQLDASKTDPSLLAALKSAGHSVDHVGDLYVLKTTNTKVPELEGLQEGVVISKSSIGASLGHSLTQDSWKMLTLSLLCLGVFISFVYGWVLGLATIVALVSDVILTSVVAHIMGIEISSMIVGALLMIMGYSINDSVVTADRIKSTVSKSDYCKSSVQTAIEATFFRNVMTGVSTLLVVFSLLVFGGESLYGFSVVVFAGVAFGMLSSLTIVPAIAEVGVRRGSGVKVPVVPSIEGNV